MRGNGLMRTGMLTLLAILGLAACATMGARESLLYERIRVSDPGGIPRSGRDAIAIVVDDFVANLVADGRVNARFKGIKPADVPRVKSNIADQICEASGGPCSYYGKDMKTAHQGMKITEAEWNATVENLVKALDKHKIPDKEKSELLGLLSPMKKDIVGP